MERLSSRCFVICWPRSRIAVRFIRWFQSSSSSSSRNSRVAWSELSGMPSSAAPDMRTSSDTSTDLDDRAPGDRTFDVRLEGLRQLVESDRGRDDRIQVTRLEVACEALPYREAHRARRKHRVDAEQVHAAQDERHDGTFQLRARGETDAGDVAPEVRGARQPREHVAAEVVDCAAPLRFFERTRAEIEPCAQQHAWRAELLEVF